MLNELLPLLRGPPRKSFRSYGSLEASVPVKSAGMWRTLQEGKRVREGPGNQGGKGLHRGRNTRPGREGWLCPGSPIPDPKSRIPVPASPQPPPPPARAHCSPPPAIGRFERAWRCVPDVRHEPAAAGPAGSCSSPLPGRWRREGVGAFTPSHSPTGNGGARETPPREPHGPVPRGKRGAAGL